MEPCAHGEAVLLRLRRGRSRGGGDVPADENLAARTGSDPWSPPFEGDRDPPLRAVRLGLGGGGFALNSLLVLYLYVRFHLSAAETGTALAAMGVLSAFSQLASARIAARIGLVRTMVFTHLPANVCLILAGIVPFPALAIGLLLVRASLSQMDVPARQALVMRLVDPDERAAAASITNVPRSLATATTPALAGVLLDFSHFGWPLVIGGATKAVYDLLLLAQPLDRD